MFSINTKTAFRWFFAAAAGTALPFFLLAPGRADKETRAKFTGINYAHRGLHTRDDSVPENSLAAFRLAAQAGYGIELDVRLTKDGQVVVFHDDTLERVCNVPGRVDDYTYLELSEFRLAGTDQRIPLFIDVLANISGVSALIVELKQGKNREELCRKTYEILKTYKGAFCVESFDPMYIAWFRKNAPEVFRGQLAMPAKDYGDAVSKPAAVLASSCLLNFLTRPHFIAYKIGRRPAAVRFSELLGAVKVGWTSHDIENEKKLDSVIFEFYSPKPKY